MTFCLWCGVAGPGPFCDATCRADAEREGLADHPSTMRTYFIRSGRAGLIKIGRTTDLAQRLDKLGEGSPEALSVLCVVPSWVAAESDMHRRFAHLRARGEWFHPGADLVAFIDALRQPVLPVAQPGDQPSIPVVTE